MTITTERKAEIAENYRAAYLAFNGKAPSLSHGDRGWLHIDGTAYRYNQVVEMTETLRARVLCLSIKALPGGGELADHLAQQFHAHPAADVIDRLRRAMGVVAAERG